MYGIGRPSERWDAPALESALDACAPGSWSMRSVVLELVLSEPFRTRGVRPATGR